MFCSPSDSHIHPTEDFKQILSPYPCHALGSCLDNSTLALGSKKFDCHNLMLFVTLCYNAYDKE